MRKHWVAWELPSYLSEDLVVVRRKIHSVRFSLTLYAKTVDDQLKVRLLTWLV